MWKKRGLVTAGSCFCASVFGWVQHSEAATNKVTICHKSLGKYHQIVVAAPALAAHLRHDDCLVDDGVPCTADSCNASLGCVHASDNSQCDDGVACTDDICDPATGCQYADYPCDDSNACTVDACDPATGCLHGPDPCGDGVVCPPEECDDGNTVPGDGCGATCQNEGGGIPNDSCTAPIAVGDGTRTYTNIGANTDGPDEPATCVFENSTNVFADIWYCYTASCTGTAMASLCGSDYDTALAVYDGCGCPTAPPLACNDDGCGAAAGNVQSRVEFPAMTGQSYLVRVGGFQGDQGDGRLTLACNFDACANGSGDCSEPSPTGEPGCGDAFCCAATCELDQFCCDVTWDATCAGEAEGVCGGSFPACGPGSGVCGVPDNTPGCDNVDCCNTVCTVDPYCCLTVWDEFCVDEAASLCLLTCGPGAGDCHSAHATPGCESQACCNTVCEVDPFCCKTEWDQTCVTAAAVCP